MSIITSATMGITGPKFLSDALQNTVTSSSPAQQNTKEAAGGTTAGSVTGSSAGTDVGSDVSSYQGLDTSHLLDPSHAAAVGMFGIQQTIDQMIDASLQQLKVSGDKFSAMLDALMDSKTNDMLAVQTHHF